MTRTTEMQDYRNTGCHFSCGETLAARKKVIRTWLTKIQQSDWSVAVVYNLIDHAVEIHILKQ